MEDTFRLINSLLGYLNIGQMGVGAFAPVWDDLWPRLQRIEKEPVRGIFPGLAGLFDRKTFYEPVDECTDQSWFQRYDGAVATRDALQAQKELVAAECDAQFADLYRDLVVTVDGYAMDIRALLFEPKTFDLADDGTRAIPCGVRAALERAGLSSSTGRWDHRQASTAPPAGRRAVRPVANFCDEKEHRAPDRAAA